MKMTRRKLSSDQQTAVVMALASFDAPTTIASKLLAEHGIEITVQAIECYDPTKKAGSKLSPRWTQLFHSARQQFVTDTAGIGIAHRAVRLHMLDRMARRAEGAGEFAMAAALLEQAAKEVGDIYSNRRQISGGADGHVGRSGVAYELMSPDDRDVLRAVLTRNIEAQARLG